MSFRPSSASGRPPGPTAATSGRPPDAGPQAIGTAAAALIGLFLVLLAVFIYLSGLDAASTRPPEPAAGGAGIPAGAASGGRPLGASAESEYREVEQADWGYALLLPATWRETAPAGGPTAFRDADHDLIVQHPATGARLAISAWQAAGRGPLETWVLDAARGMESTDGRWPRNARVAGEPALALWGPERPALPIHYAVFLGHGERYYAVSYAAYDGGAALPDFAKALVSLTWLDGGGPVSILGGDEGQDMVPLFPQPASRYFPLPAVR
jgi:hypothetical protein